MALKKFNFNATPQFEPLPGTNQQKNNAGGFSFVIDKWKMLERFLILGSDKGTYYVSEQKLTLDNARCVLACADENPKKLLDVLTQISVEGRAPRNDQALFALAILAAKSPQTLKNFDITTVARIGTHIYDFVGYVESQGLRKWGRSFRTLVGKWYLQDIDNLMYQVVKYRQRNGWSHKDLLRLSHVKPDTAMRNAVFSWITKGITESELYPGSKLNHFDCLQSAKTEAEVILILERSHLPWECVPTGFLKSPAVWESLLPTLPMTAMVRNLGRLSAIGMLTADSEAERQICAKLSNQEYIHKSRLHPIAILKALKTYEQGHGDKGKLTWTRNMLVAHALEAAFYLAFKNVTPTGKRLMLALDVSGSMGSTAIAGLNMTAREGSAAMALVTNNVEENCFFTMFSDGNRNNYPHKGIIPFKFEKGTFLIPFINAISGLPFGGTDCSLPMMYALENRIPIDAFIVYTDSETWAGDIHPTQALKLYREMSGIDAKEVVVGMTATEFTIADPSDDRQMDVVGFDASAPAVINDFIRGGTPSAVAAEEEPTVEE